MTRDVEADQGCCGTGSSSESTTVETERGCCEPRPSSEPAGIETDQGCCGSGSSSESVEVETGQECCSATGATAASSCGSDPTETVGGGANRRARTEDATPEIPTNAKSPAEIATLETAAELTVAFLSEMQDAWAPHWTEADVAAFLHDRLRVADYEPAWGWTFCPGVHAGADARVGHTEPGDRAVPPGELLHVDFGVSHEGYAADLQRVYYHPGGPDEPAPSALESAFRAVRTALEAGRDALEPGARGHQVDAAARSTLANAGWAEFDHAFGHQVGRSAHDGGTLLGPTRERYGDRPYGTVGTDEVYSIELGVGTVYGYVGLEEMVRVTGDGTEFLVAPQTELQRLPVR